MEPLCKLRSVFGIALLIAFWRRLRQRRVPPSLKQSLSRRWTANSLKNMLGTLQLSLSPNEEDADDGLMLDPVKGPPSDGSSPIAAAADSERSTISPSPRSLSKTWSPRHLTHIFRRFRGRAPRQSPLVARPVQFTTWCEFMEDSLHHPEWGYYTDGRIIFGEVRSSSSVECACAPCGEHAHVCGEHARVCCERACKVD